MSRAKAAEDRVVNDQYCTPHFCVRALIPFLPKNWQQMAILDPGCGNGNIMAELIRQGADPKRVFGVESDPERVTEGRAFGLKIFLRDFLAEQSVPQLRNKFQLIIGNPPYRQAQDFIAQSIEILPENGLVFFLLRLNFCEGQRRNVWMRDRVPDAYVLPKRPKFRTPDGKLVLGKNGKPGQGDGTAYAWLSWPKGERQWGDMAIADLALCVDDDSDVGSDETRRGRRR